MFLLLYLLKGLCNSSLKYLGVCQNPLWATLTENPEGARLWQPAEQLGNPHKSLSPMQEPSGVFRLPSRVSQHARVPYDPRLLPLRGQRSPLESAHRDRNSHKECGPIGCAVGSPVRGCAWAGVGAGAGAGAGMHASLHACVRVRVRACVCVRVLVRARLALRA